MFGTPQALGVVENSRRMEVVECKGSKQHQQCVKDVKVNFLCLELPIFPHDILDDTEDGTNQNEEACSIQNLQKSSPRCGDCQALRCGITLDAIVEQARDKHEETKEGNLYGQSHNDDCLSLVSVLLSLGAREFTAP